MTKKVVVPLADGFEEIEAVTIIDVLRRAGVDVAIAGLGSRDVVHGAHGVNIARDAAIETIDGATIDMVVLPGGMPGARALTEDPHVQGLLKAVADKGGWTCAICAAPMALGPRGLTAGKSVTSYPGFEDRFEYGAYLTERVVVDGTVITSRGPGTAMEFALTLVDKLCGTETASDLKSSMLVAQAGPAYEA